MLVSERLHKRPTFKLPSAAFAEQYTASYSILALRETLAVASFSSVRKFFVRPHTVLGWVRCMGEVEALTVEVNRTISVQFFKPGAILVLKTISTPPRTTHDRIYRRAYKHSKYTYLRFGSIANSSCYIFLVESNKAISRRDKKDG